jgi:hypothetical protein
LQGVIISSLIGVKVFANTLSTLFGFAPTKCRIFKATKDDFSDKIEVDEIPSKGASDMRLKDYGVTNESIIFFVATIE